MNKESTVISLDLPHEGNCLLHPFLALADVFKSKPLKPFIPDPEVTLLSSFPGMDPAASQNFPFFHYRRLGPDLFEAISFAFFELCLRNRDSRFLTIFEQNSESYFLLANAPKGLSLKWKRRHREEYRRNFNTFVDAIKDYQAKLADRKQSSYSVICSFYEKLAHSGISHFFKIFIRGYVLGRIQELGLWEHCRKKRNFGKTFENFANLKSYDPENLQEDLNLVCSYILDSVCVYSLGRSPNGKFSKLDQIFRFPDSLPPDKQQINLLFANSQFYALYYYSQYSLELCMNCQHKFRPLWLLTCNSLDAHHLCATCFEKNRFPERCLSLLCDSHFAKRARKEMIAAVETRMDYRLKTCPGCGLVSKLLPSLRTYACQRCGLEVCSQHAKPFRNCYCFCAGCGAETEAMGELFPTRRACRCGMCFCLDCGFQGKDELLCQCHCPACSARLEDGKCRFCAQGCSLCLACFPAEEAAERLRDCQKCGSRFCRNCQILDFVRHQDAKIVNFCSRCNGGEL